MCIGSAARAGRMQWAMRSVLSRRKITASCVRLSASSGVESCARKPKSLIMMPLVRHAKSEGEENRAVSGRKKSSRGYREIRRAGAVMQFSIMAGLLAVFHLLTTGHGEGHIEDTAESVRLEDWRMFEPGTMPASTERVVR
jgi:hypothetical protein